MDVLHPSIMSPADPSFLLRDTAATSVTLLPLHIPVILALIPTVPIPKIRPLHLVQMSPLLSLIGAYLNSDHLTHPHRARSPGIYPLNLIHFLFTFHLLLTPSCFSSFDLSELAFAVLGVQKMECRKRFLCEMRVNYNSNPIIGTAYNMISRQVFADYQSEIDEKQPKSMKHCYELYKSCRGPNDPTPEQEDNELEETSTQKDENSAESARSVPVRNSIPVPSLILARTKTE